MNISQEDAERYRAVLNLIGVDLCSHCNRAEYAREALSPKPEMDEVEVVRWLAHDEAGDPAGCFKTEKECTDRWSGPAIKLTGKLTRPKPRKVTHREEIGQEHITYEFLKECGITTVTPSNNKKFYIEWETEES